ncbi:cation diffusion facilitator family transporter [Flavobacterium sp.]|uniref:cation diffusion facilitator family transporter n=1 Tax=Flavobacterium sp. TaxID=239 RepID=UPI00286D7D94|nr:cation diffusion facilitator family transporter [Flavobacterium sp.]
MEHHHHHDHRHHHHHQVQGKNLLFSIVLNLIITIAQVIGGLISGSLALISDALHNFSDVLSLVFSYVAHKLSKKKVAINENFGYKRAELIAAFVNAITLIIVALFLIYGAIERFFNPQHIASELVIWLSILGIVVNGLSALMLKNDAAKNLNMKSAYLHLFTDMLASVAVLIGGLLMKYFQWFWVDSVLTFIIAIYLILVGFDLLKKSTQMLMLFTPKNIDINKIISEIHKIEGVEKLHHIHIWHLNDHELQFEAHLDCREDIKISEFNEILHKMRHILFYKFHIDHVNIQPEYNVEEVSKDFIVQD